MSKASPSRGLLAAALSAGVVTLGAFGGVASAQSEDATPLNGTDVNVESIPSQMQVAIERDLGISAEAYAEQATAAGNASNTSARLAGELGDSFGGSWFNSETNKLHVKVTDNAAAQVAVDLGAEVEVGGVSLAQLDAASAELAGWASGQGGLVAGVSVDVQSSSVVVTLGNGEEAAALEGALPDVGVDVTTKQETAERRLVDINGGDGYFTGNQAEDDIVGVCSFGFPAYNASGNPIYLTAGHCYGDEDFSVAYREIPGEQPTLPLERLGDFDVVSFGENNTDYATINVTGDNIAPAVNTWDDNATTITGVVEPIEGMEVCKSGRTTQYTCGEITHAATTWEGVNDGQGNLVDIDGFEHSACTEGGDSGGAIVAGSLAVGITSAAAGNADGGCEITDGQGNPIDPISLGVSLTENVLPHLDGVAVLSEVNAPVIETPEDGQRIGEDEQVIAGTANPFATVSLQINDQAAEVTADEDGAWEIRPDSALPVGEYSVTASQTLTVGGETWTSEETSLSFFVAPAAPAITEPADGTESDNATPTVSGTAQAGATVTVSVDEETAGETEADAEGNWTLDVTEELAPGTHTITAVQVIEGSESAPATVTYIVLDDQGEIPPPTTPPGDGEEGANPPGADAPEQDDEDDLADTGANFILPLIIIGGVALAGGTFMVLKFRRRNASGTDGVA
ncbi:S1 family peptidase [Actinoalloteichus hymeniacidonis]|uniref:Bacterial Ig-like domain-containing protein n=1 Tax=Actinoalloteichus hymeniacidonis TaxID=340345 RepID=A0AAC9HVS2_9PSEU|nr:Ig-like domain-containing protein [Actinoalloteichus hymeniacidonis]AOS66056.1 hypothetical protein TL08_26435 [Actinoalloteichus hymeniacidonis]MBB5905841.1 hypothetical protein [Actinoalloteichus hymeniacidonis]